MFELSSREGLPIRGAIDAPQRARAVIVLSHGFKGFKDWGFFPWLAEHLCDAGVAVVRFNMSRSGVGEDPESLGRLDLLEGDTYSTQVNDLVDVVKFSQARFRGLPLFLLGHSRGGAVSLLASREIEGLEGVVTWSAIAHADRWNRGFPELTSPAVLADYEANRERLDILAAAAKLTAPLLAIHGGDDKSVSPEESQEIVTRATDASLLILDRASHTFNAIHPLVHVPKALRYAAAVSTHFVAAYS